MVLSIILSSDRQIEIWLDAGDERSGICLATEESVLHARSVAIDRLQNAINRLKSADGELVQQLKV